MSQDFDPASTVSVPRPTADRGEVLLDDLTWGLPSGVATIDQVNEAIKAEALSPDVQKRTTVDGLGTARRESLMQSRMAQSLGLSGQFHRLGDVRRNAIAQDLAPRVTARFEQFGETKRFMQSLVKAPDTHTLKGQTELLAKGFADRRSLAHEVRMFAHTARQIYYTPTGDISFSNVQDAIAQAVSIAPSQIFWGCLTIGASANTVYATPGYNTVAIQTTQDYSFTLTRNCTLRKLRIRHNLANGNGNSVVYTVILNNVATGITVTQATGAVGNGSDLSNTAAGVAGDLVDLRAVKAAGISNGSVGLTASLELA